MRILLSILAFVAIEAIQAQESSFKKYKEEGTNAVIAYSGGLPLPRLFDNLSDLFPNQSQDNKPKTKIYKSSSTDLKPTLRNGKYYLYLKECPDIGHWTGERDKYHKLYLYIKTDFGDVIKLTGSKTSAEFGYGTWYSSDYNDIKFYLSKDQFVKIASSGFIHVDLVFTPKNDFEDFRYVFDGVDLSGYRDFAQGMGWPLLE